MIFALAGNQNCGKTTLFNALTGSNQHVGNFPGVTVDQKIGEIKDGKSGSVVDLPGIYSLRPYTQEEIVTRDFILKGKPDGIINIVDATNIERNLYLTLQLLELRVPMVLALNMMDEVRANGGTIDVQELSRCLGIPVVPISAVKGEGVSELLNQAVHTARTKTLPKVYDFCSEESAVHRCIHAVVHMIQDHADKADIPARFATTKLIEGDENILQQLQLDQNEKELLEHCIVQMENESGLDRNAALADMRYSFIEKVVEICVVKCHESKEHRRSVQMDKVLTGKYTALPVFFGVMFLIFYLTFNLIGQNLSDFLSLGIDKLTMLADKGLTAYGINPVVHSLIIDGVFCRCRQCAFLPAHHCDAVFLPVHFGGYRLHGPGGFCHGQAPAEDRPFRAQLCAYAHRLRLHGAGYYGHPYRILGSGPENDHSADTVHELLGKNTHLCGVFCRLFPKSCGPGDDRSVCDRYPAGDPFGDYAEGYGFPWAAGSLRDGAAQLPYALSQERRSAAVGKGPGLPGTRLYRYFPGYYYYLVSADL